MMKLEMECKMLAGAESKVWLADLTKVVERMERAAGLLAGKGIKAAAPADEEEEETDAPEAAEAEEEEDFAPKAKKAAKKTAAAFEEEEETETAEAEEEEEDFTAPPAKKTAAKAKKLTVDDVNDACKALAASIGGKPGRAKVLEILKKNFKTESVSELKPEQYAKCVQLMAV